MGACHSSKRRKRVHRTGVIEVDANAVDEIHSVHDDGDYTPTYYNMCLTMDQGEDDDTDEEIDDLYEDMESSASETINAEVIEVDANAGGDIHSVHDDGDYTPTYYNMCPTMDQGEDHDTDEKIDDLYEDMGSSASGTINTEVYFYDTVIYKRSSLVSRDSVLSDKSSGSSTCNAGAKNTSPVTMRRKKKNNLNRQKHASDNKNVNIIYNISIQPGSDPHENGLVSSILKKTGAFVKPNKTPWKEHCVDPSDHIPQMVEIFRSQLEGSIKVREVISYLHFIEDSEEILEHSSPRAAVSCLLDRILECTEPGKWMTFLNALKTVGYQYIASLLTCETELDYTMHRKLVKLFEPEIINRMDTAEFLDNLYQEDVISVMDIEEIKCEERNRGQIAANLMMLDRVPRKLENWYHVFINTMKKCGMVDVADIFESCELTKTGATTESSCTHCITSCRDNLNDNNKQKTDIAYVDTDNKDGYYIHPTNDDEILPPRPIPIPRKRSPLPPLPPVPSLQPSSTHPVRKTTSCNIEPSSTLQNTNKDVNTSSCKLKTGHPTVISKLKAEEESLRRRVEEAKLEKQLREKVKSLKMELVALTAVPVNDTEHADEESHNEASDVRDVSPIPNDTTHAKDLFIEEGIDSGRSMDDTTPVKQVVDLAQDNSQDIHTHDIHITMSELTNIHPERKADLKDNTLRGVQKGEVIAIKQPVTVDIANIDQYEKLFQQLKEIEKNIQPVLMRLQKMTCLPVADMNSGTTDDHYVTFAEPSPHLRAYGMDSGIGSGQSMLSSTDETDI